MISFPDYPAVLLRMLNQCVREPHVHLAVLLMQPNGEARMDFIQVCDAAGRDRVGCAMQVGNGRVSAHATQRGGTHGLHSGVSEGVIRGGRAGLCS